VSCVGSGKFRGLVTGPTETSEIFSLSSRCSVAKIRSAHPFGHSLAWQASFQTSSPDKIVLCCNYSHIWRRRVANNQIRAMLLQGTILSSFCLQHMGDDRCPGTADVLGHPSLCTGHLGFTTLTSQLLHHLYNLIDPRGAHRVTAGF